MSRRQLGLLIFGIIILPAIGLAACSTEAPAMNESAGAEVAGRDIKVYESPT